MKRVWLLAATSGLLLAGSSVSAASGDSLSLGAKRVCTSGQVQCYAMVVTRAGNAVRTAMPDALPAGMSPANYHNAYNLPTTGPAGATVAIVDAFDDATIYADLKKYSNTFGLPVMPKCTASVTTSCFKKANRGAPAGSAVPTGWDVEIALDVETVHAICQNCKIVLVEAPDNSLTNLVAAEKYAAKQAPIVSNSFGAYGDDGALGASLDGAFNQQNHAIVVSAGDDGYGVSWPASLNSVISVGGTSLTLNGSGGYGSEIVWGHGSGGTGSGCSSAAVGGSAGVTAVKAKTFQKNAAGWAATKCGTFRGDNDVSANADPNTGSAIYVGSFGGFIQVGGTSLAAPLIAGVYALKGNAASAAYPASFLYSHLGTASFRDVTSGNDDVGNWPLACPAASTQCAAAAGYDLPTGVGTPKGTSGF
jgi:subtilase family serine protease